MQGVSVHKMQSFVIEFLWQPIHSYEIQPSCKIYNNTFQIKADNMEKEKKKRVFVNRIR